MSLQDAYWAAPPVSRTITAATVLLSVPGHLGLYSLIWVIFLQDYVFTIRQLPQLWRIVTCFFITGPKLGMIFDPYFLFHYSSQLELGSARFSRPGSYCFFLLFVATIILLSGGIFLNGYTLLSPLSMAITYIFAQEDPNRQVMFFIVPLAAKYLPFATLAITLILAGPDMVLLQATGILAAHAYDFLDRIWPQFGGGKQYIATPQFIEKLFAPEAGVGVRRAAGTAFQGRSASQAQGGNRSGFTSGFNSGSFGTGRRLGGD